MIPAGREQIWHDDLDEGDSWVLRQAFLRPREIEQAKAACPTIFQRLGTIEWHGVHRVGLMRDYGKLLAEGQFEAIKTAVAKL